MKKVLLLVLLAVLFVLIAFQGCGKPQKETAKKETVEKGKIVWSSSLDSTLNLAAEKNQPILIDFYTDWCSWCKKLDEDTFQDSTVIDYLKDFYMVKINAEEQTEIAKKYNIVGFPTVVLCKHDGSEIDRFHYAEPEDFIRTVKDYLNDKGTLADLIRQEETYPDSIELKFEIADKYVYRNDSENAAVYYRKIIALGKDDTTGVVVQALMGLGNAFNRSKEYDSAKVYFNQVLTDYPDAEDIERARYYMGYIAEKLGNKEEAREYWQTCMENVPDSAQKAFFKNKIESLEKEAE